MPHAGRFSILLFATAIESLKNVGVGEKGRLGRSRRVEFGFDGCRRRAGLTFAVGTVITETTVRFEGYSAGNAS